jgi:hypothetical protein
VPLPSSGTSTLTRYGIAGDGREDGVAASVANSTVCSVPDESLQIACIRKNENRPPRLRTNIRIVGCARKMHIGLLVAAAPGTSMSDVRSSAPCT